MLSVEFDSCSINSVFFVFIPEVGDQVLLGFRHGDPARPYVMGSLFNGTTGNGGGSNNSIKSLKTRSGISVILNDDNRSLEIKEVLPLNA